MSLATDSVRATFSVLKRCPKVLILTLISATLTELSGLVPSVNRWMILIFILFLNLIIAAAVPLIVKDALSSRAVSLEKSLSKGLRKLHRIFGLTLLIALISGMASFLTSVIIPSPEELSLLRFFLFLVIVSIAVYMTTKLIFAIPILMMENSGIIDSLKMSWQASRGKFWSVFGAILLLGLTYIPYSIASYMSLFPTGAYMGFALIALSFVPSALLAFLPAAYYLKVKRAKRRY